MPRPPSIPQMGPIPFSGEVAEGAAWGTNSESNSHPSILSPLKTVALPQWQWDLPTAEYPLVTNVQISTTREHEPSGRRNFSPSRLDLPSGWKHVILRETILGMLPQLWFLPHELDMTLTPQSNQGLTEGDGCHSWLTPLIYLNRRPFPNEVLCQVKWPTSTVILKSWGTEDNLDVSLRGEAHWDLMAASQVSTVMTSRFPW